jgi:hypothetical protein
VSSHKKYRHISQAVIIKEFEVQFNVWQGASQYGNGQRNLVEVRGASGKLQTTRLTFCHFDKNPYSQMNVNLATQLLSRSTVEMIRDAIADDDIVLSLQKKGMYNHVADLCEH